MKANIKRITYTLIVTLIIVFSTTFAILMTLERSDYRNYLQGEYSKNMHELISSVQNIRINLSKSAIINSRDQKIITFQEIFRYSSIANDKLHSMPISEDTIQYTSNFLSQVGDFSNTLAKSIVENKDISKESYNNIEKLKDQSFNLENKLSSIVTDVNQGNLKWGEIRKKVSGVLAKDKYKLIPQKFENIEKQVLQYPSLIYDGPFSDNVLDIKPKVNNEKAVTRKEAENVVRKLLGKNNIESIKIDTNKRKTRIDSYRFIVSIKGRSEKESKIVCEVSKKGGKLIYLLDERNVGQPKINMNKAIDIGNKYLKDIGFDNMIPTYTLNYSNVAVINYIYKQDNVMIYPDQIKLKISLDKGEIIGVESEKYLVAHHKRNIPKPKVTKEEAKKKISDNFKVNSEKLVMIPTPNNTEKLCYEFSGTYKKDNFKIYIDANTGFEERIIQILDTPNGELTM